MITLIGMDPSVQRRYHWLGDPACDRAASDVEGWFARGAPLAQLPGATLTTFVCQPLKPTTLAIVYGHAHMGAVGAPAAEAVDARAVVARNIPAMYRAAVAYGVVAVEDGPALRRVHDAGGLRLDDAVLDSLDRMHVTAGDRSVSLIQHLGGLILDDATHTELEGKA